MKTRNNRIEQLRVRARRPMTPGEILGGHLAELGISQTALAEKIGVGRRTVCDLVNGNRSMSHDMAHRLGRFFGDGAAIWLRMQQDVDLWDLLHADAHLYDSIERITAPANELVAA